VGGIPPALLPRQPARRPCEQLASQTERPEPELQHPGYVINAAELATNQLRRRAEAAIRRSDRDEAMRLLEIAQLQRPDNRNIAGAWRPCASTNR
jgi:hypothetical protein